MMHGILNIKKSTVLLYAMTSSLYCNIIETITEFNKLLEGIAILCYIITRQSVVIASRRININNTLSLSVKQCTRLSPYEN
jgi:hypothetical protein